jgi:type IV pilus assembly protein PilP
LFKPDQDKVAAVQPSKSKRKKRMPQTPLERISLEQLQLKAVIRASSGNRALVEDNSGKGYIIKNGTYIGLNSGIVTQINPDNVVIEEEVENLMGELVLRNTEIKLQKPTGE